MAMKNRITVFTKSWPNLPIAELARFIKDLGLDGVELPVRPKYPVNPGNITAELPKAAELFREYGLVIGSIAGDTDEKTIAACGAAGIGIIRTCIGIDMKIGYRATEEKIRAQFDALLPALKKHKVAIGVQNHFGFMVGSAIGVMHLIERYDPRYVCAVLDPAHCALDGEPEAMALDIVLSHLGLVNFKSGSRRPVNGPGREETQWQVTWTTAQQAGYSWRTMVRCLRERGYKGDLCLSAEYSNPKGQGALAGDATTALLKQDIAYIKKLLAEDAESGEMVQATDWKLGGGK
jgi:sugar phosphate isomerase/epimerase